MNIDSTYEINTENDSSRVNRDIQGVRPVIEIPKASIAY